MRTGRNLQKVGSMASKGLMRLHRRSMEIQSEPKVTREAERAAAYIVIELLNLWASFSKYYFISTALGARSRSGLGYTASPSPNSNVALGLAIVVEKPKASARPDGSWHRRDEPDWHNPHVLQRVLEKNSCSNHHIVDNIISGSADLFRTLPVFRNYFAHKNFQTYQAAMTLAPSFGVSVARRPVDVILAPALSGPNIVLVEWVDEIQIAVDYLCY